MQGSVLGVLDHNEVLETVDDGFLVKAHKYVDDMTTVEAIPRDAIGYMDEAYEKQSFHAKKTEQSIAQLKTTCQNKNLKINTKKTQLLSISTNKDPTTVWINEGEEEIQSGRSLKLLGFHFGEKPDVSLQIENIKMRAMARFYVLRKYSKFMGGNELKTLYTELVRSCLEYSSVTYGPLLTQYQSNDLENVQKRCLKCLFGYNKSYQELLEVSGFETLKARREAALLRFATKSQKNPVYEHWFPENTNHTSLRHPKKYQEKLARTNRLYKSPVFTMRRLLNENYEENPPENPLAIEVPANDPYND